jgi:hypothetical protein
LGICVSYEFMNLASDSEYCKSLQDIMRRESA